MRDSIPSVEKEFAAREQDVGLHRLRLGCILAAVLTPPGSLIDLMVFDRDVNSIWSIGALFGFRVLCSAGVVPIFLLSYQPFAARYFRLLGVALAFAPAFCMAGIIAVTEGSRSGYYVGLILVLLGVGVVMQWTRRQTMFAAGMVMVLYLVATLVAHDLAWEWKERTPPAPILRGAGWARDSSRFLAGDLRDVRAFVDKLASSEDGVSEYLARQLDDPLRSKLTRSPLAPDALEELRRPLVTQLNAVIGGEMSIWNKERFHRVQIRSETEHWMKAVGVSPKPVEVARLNRLLLEDAYPVELARINTQDIWPTLGTNLWFLLLTSIIIVIGNHFSTEVRYSDFVGRFRLIQSRREAEQTSERLAEANRRLKELDQLKDNFFANVSHELRTPLTLLLGPVEHLQKHPRVVEHDQLRDFVSTMHENGMRLLKLINDLLDLVRLQAKALVLKPAPINVSAYAGKLVSSIRGFAEDRGLKLIWNVQPDLETVAWDEAKIDKVFLNLLFNAIKFTPAGGEVSWHAYKEGTEAVVEVRDTGVGISAENQKFLFQRFWQADSSSQRKHQGAGIGLALVKELVEAHGGAVSVRSDLGKGTSVTVRLPILCAAPVKLAGNGDGSTSEALPGRAGAGVAAGGGSTTRNGNGAEVHEERRVEKSPGEMEAEAARMETQKHLDELYRRAELHASITPLRQTLRPWNPTAGPKNRPQVLVVDDEPGMRRFLGDRLQEDYVVHEAVDGQQGVDMARHILPDAIVCDMMMPEKDGIEVCKELRNYHTTRTIPLLMLTARADDETKLTALAAGASDFLAKPFGTEELRLRIKNLVDARRLERELQQLNKKLHSTLDSLKETEMQLVQSEKMGALGRLVAGIIHEINNPLNFAKTGVHVLAMHEKDLPEAERVGFRDIVKDITEGITRVSAIVGDLRQFSHPDNEALHEVDVPAAAAAALRFMAAEWRDGRVDVSNELPHGLLVRANRNKLVQVFINMFQNAFDAMRSHPPADGKPRLQLRTWDEGEVRKIGIRDNGPGIAAEHVDHVFEPFFTTKDVGKGMGLGLSICFRILEEAGGRITLDTEKGRYCEFVLEFPIPA